MATNNFSSFMSFKSRSTALKAALRYRKRGGNAVVKKTKKNKDYPFVLYTSR